MWKTSFILSYSIALSVQYCRCYCNDNSCRKLTSASILYIWLMVGHWCLCKVICKERKSLWELCSSAMHCHLCNPHCPYVCCNLIWRPLQRAREPMRQAWRPMYVCHDSNDSVWQYKLELSIINWPQISGVALTALRIYLERSSRFCSTSDVHFQNWLIPCSLLSL